VTEESENRKVLTSCPAHAPRAIGEVAQSVGGVENTRSRGNGLGHPPLPLPCPVALRGVPIKGYKESTRRARGLNFQKAIYYLSQFFSEEILNEVVDRDSSLKSKSILTNFLLNHKTGLPLQVTPFNYTKKPL